MSKRVHPKSTPGGEFLRVKPKSEPPKPVHACDLPPVDEGDEGDVWYCFECHTRYTRTLVITRKVWLKRSWTWPKHKHKRLLDYSHCRCGKFMSQYDGIGLG